MNYTIEHKDNIVIFELKNKSVESNIASELKARMLITAQPDIDALIINMSKVETMDSSGLGALLLANRQLSEHDIPLVLVGVSDFIRSLMSMTKIDDVFEFFDTIEEALEFIENRKEEE